MKYENINCLPQELIKEIQKYVQGMYIYVPIKITNKKSWGENSGYKKEIQKRNKNIKEKYKLGISIDSLADEYYLSIDTIKKIIYKKE